MSGKFAAGVLLHRAQRLSTEVGNEVTRSRPREARLLKLQERAEKLIRASDSESLVDHNREWREDRYVMRTLIELNRIVDYTPLANNHGGAVGGGEGGGVSGGE